MPTRLRCVYCRHRPVDPAWRPFCSERCKMADLGRWLQGDYRVPAAPADDDAPDTPADDDAPDTPADADETDES